MANEAERGDLNEVLIPKYKFEWDDGTVRTTDENEIENPDFNEWLADKGREDDECEVTLVGYSG